jgi:hypothetical protein
LRFVWRTARGLFSGACYRRRVRSLLVLWDIDFTLIDAGGVGTHLYRMVFRDMFGTDLPAAANMAGRTDRAIVLDTLARAGIPEPRQQGWPRWRPPAVSLPSSTAGRCLAPRRRLPRWLRSLRAGTAPPPTVPGDRPSGCP